jgi:hypothetical protein
VTPVGSLTVKAPRAIECPVQLETALEEAHPVGQNDPAWRGAACGDPEGPMRPRTFWRMVNRTASNPDKWRPLIMSFQQFYGLAPGTVHRSELAKIPEAAYRA